MRLNFLLVAAAVAFFASCDAIGVTQAKATEIASADIADSAQDIGTTARFLRGDQNVNNGEVVVEGQNEEEEGDDDEEEDEADDEEEDDDEEERIPKLKFKTKRYGAKVQTLDDAAEAAANRAAAKAAATKYAINHKNPLKKSAAGLRKEGAVPNAALVSRVGRDLQRYSKDGRKLMSCTVVSHPTMKGGNVLLISSSGTKGKWVLPKGGWDKGESIKKNAHREVFEEGGVRGTLMTDLGKINFGSHKTGPGKADKKYRYYGFEMKANKILKKWPEDSRERKWVSYAEAKILLKGEPEMIRMVARAERAKLQRAQKTRAWLAAREKARAGRAAAAARA